MKTFKLLAFAFACVVALSAVADEGARETFGKWRIGVGGAFNGGVDARLGVRNAPVPLPLSVPTAFPRSRDKALERAAGHVYDGVGDVDGFIRPDSEDDGVFTTNWKLPETAYRGEGEFLLDNAYSEILPGTDVQAGGDSSRDATQFGISAEVSRELWIHDENDEHRWGVDFAAAFSYFFKRGVYRTAGNMRRTDTLREGSIQTPVEDADAMFFYDMEWDSPVDGMYGYGNYDVMAGGPALQFAGIKDDEMSDVFADTLYSVSRGFSASGDYRELEMLFMFRPWYEITDWWRVFAQVGLGVSWGRFDTSFHSGGLSHDEDFSQWDCYGVAGLGTAFRYDDWTLGIDFLGRFLRDDLDVDGKYVKGSIERSNWGFRIMLGYEF